MEVSIIFVNWNSVGYLRDSIASVYKHTANIRFEVIVVDNASPAGDAEIIEREFPHVTLIKSKENLGFAGANNVGFKHSSGKYIVFINPDTQLVSPAINIMLERLRMLPDAGILGCKLLNSDLSVQTSCIQTFPTILNQLLDADCLRSLWPNSKLFGIGALFSDTPEPARVEVISGACMMVKRDVFEQVGLFAEDYFMYAEDLDLCYKVNRAGYSNYYVGIATVIHHVGKSSNPLWAIQMKWKAVPRFCEKNRGHLYALLFRISMTCAATVRLVIISSAAFFGNMLVNKESLKSASAKWAVILKTLWPQFWTKSTLATNRPVSGCGV